MPLPHLLLPEVPPPPHLLPDPPPPSDGSLHELLTQIAHDDKKKSFYEPHALLQSPSDAAALVERTRPLASLRFKLALDLGVVGADEDRILAALAPTP
jgi:hypothetical protein